MIHHTNRLKEAPSPVYSSALSSKENTELSPRVSTSPRQSVTSPGQIKVSLFRAQQENLTALSIPMEEKSCHYDSPIETGSGASTTYLKKSFQIVSSLAYATTYFLPVIAGESSLEELFSWKNETSSVVFKGLGVISCVSHAAAFYELCEKITTLNPQKLSGKVLAAGGLLSSLLFLNAAKSGCEIVGFSIPATYLLSGTLYALRFVYSLHGAESLTNPKAHPILLENPNLSPILDKKEQALDLVRNVYIVLSAASLSACETDAVYAILSSLADDMGLSKNGFVDTTAIGLTIFGSLSSLVVGVCWGRITMEALTNFKRGEFKDHDLKTFVTCLTGALVWSALVMVGPIGVAAPDSVIQHGAMLSQVFGTETNAQQMANRIFRLSALATGFIPFSTYVHYKALHRIFYGEKKPVSSNELRESLLELENSPVENRVMSA